MSSDKYERYEITSVPEGLQISRWQALPSFGFGVIALVILVACFLTDPYHGHSRIWAGLGVSTVALVAIFGVKVETWIVSDRGPIQERNLERRAGFRAAPGTSLTAIVEVIPCDSEGTRPAFPHVLHLLAPGGIALGDGFEFRDRSTLDRFLKTLQAAAPIQMTDLISDNCSTPSDVMLE